MRRKDIPATVNVTAPAVHAGAYTTKSNFNAELYVWYLDGDSAKLNAHVTVGKRDETKKSPHRWCQLHVTVPVLNNNSVANVHFFYKFDTHLVVEYTGNNADDLYGGAQALANNSATRAAYDQLAQDFVTVAHSGP